MPKHKIITAGYLVLKQENKILMLRRYNTGYHDGDYSLIAGHGDKRESLRQCIIREAKEEAGIIIAPNDLKLIHVLSRLGDEGDDRANFFWLCSKWEGEVANLEPEKCDDLAWFENENLPGNMVPEVKKALNSISDGEQYSEFQYE